MNASMARRFSKSQKSGETEIFEGGSETEGENNSPSHLPTEFREGDLTEDDDPRNLSNSDDSYYGEDYCEDDD